MKHDMLLRGTDLRVSPIALGTAKAGIAWSGREADALLDAYLDMGGNVIDTARIYMPPTPGCGEEVIGHWLRHSGRRQDVVLMTKGGHPPIEAMHTNRMSQREMTEDLNASLQALGTDYVDVYFYHRDDPSQPAGELVERMEDFRREGKIRWYACSNWTTERMREADDYARAHGLRGFVANQCCYNVGTRHMRSLADDTLVAADEAMRVYHQAADNTMMPYCGLCEGFFHHLASQGPEAVRGRQYYSEGNLRVAEGLEALCEKYHATLTQAELGFLLTRPFPVVALAGVSRLEQLPDIMGAAEIPFRPEDFEELS